MLIFHTDLGSWNPREFFSAFLFFEPNIKLNTLDLNKILFCYLVIVHHQKHLFGHLL